MVDSTQILLALVILTLTVMLSVIGVQVYFILKEFRNTLQKVNKVLDDTGEISESVSRPVSMLSGMLMGLRGGSNLFKMFTQKSPSNENR